MTLVCIDVERSILLGGRLWRSAIDPPVHVPPADARRRGTTLRAMLTPDELAAAFAAAWAASPDGAVPPGTGSKLLELCQRAHQVLPELAMDDRELVAAIAARAPTELDAYLERCHSSDLALAIASSRGSMQAIQEIERLYRVT